MTNICRSSLANVIRLVHTLRAASNMCALHTRNTGNPSATHTHTPIHPQSHTRRHTLQDTHPHPHPHAHVRTCTHTDIFKNTVTTAWALGAIYAGKLGLTLNPSLGTLVGSMCVVLSVSPVYVGVLYLIPADEVALKGPGSQAMRCACVFVCMFVCVFFFGYVDVEIRVCTCVVCIRTRLDVLVYVNIFICMYSRVCIVIHTYTCVAGRCMQLN